MAPGLPDFAIKYNITSPTILALTLSIFLLTFSLGPLVLGQQTSPIIYDVIPIPPFFRSGPLSEMYGRTWVYTAISNVMFSANNVAGFTHIEFIVLGHESRLCIRTHRRCFNWFSLFGFARCLVTLSLLLTKRLSRTLW